jgi:membrane protease YdiL (CAAX protease family)
VTDELKQTLLRVLPFAAGLVLIAFAVRRRGMSWREDVRLVWPGGAQVAGWLFAWIAWVALEEWLSRRAGLGAPAPWRLSRLSIGLRVIGIVALAPVLEEVVFRGLLFRLIEKTRLGGPGAVLVTAALFAILHTQYAGLELALVFVDGLFLGTARWRTRSVLLTISMHALGNAFAVYQRLG